MTVIIRSSAKCEPNPMIIQVVSVAPPASIAMMVRTKAALSASV